MKILVVGSGGREHALVWKIAQSPRVSKIYCAPGNGGIAADAECLPIAVEDSRGLIELARREKIDLTVVGPETPLTLGLVDDLSSAGLPAVGPTQKAAFLEGSKGFAKEFMARHEIPTARFVLVRDRTSAEKVLDRGDFGYPVVLKADGLAAGKGVFVAASRAEADAALAALFDQRVFGSAADSVVIEEGLQGEEVSLIACSDGQRILPMVAARDHKRVFDDDRGPNTGGMGAYSTDTILSPLDRDRIIEYVLLPTVKGMAEEGNPFRGFLYAGLMLTGEGPKVLEFNARLGDPETQVILPRLESDLVPVLEGIARGDLQGIEPRWSNQASVCVVLASGGYPAKYDGGKVISGLDMARETGAQVFHAGTKRKDGKLVTAGGRVLSVSARGATLQEAVVTAYEAVNRIQFEGMHYRRDIAARALASVENSGGAG